jgi:hypothetical protein
MTAAGLWIFDSYFSSRRHVSIVYQKYDCTANSAERRIGGKNRSCKAEVTGTSARDQSALKT